MTSARNGIEIRPVKSRRDLKDFIQLPWRIYRDDPAWIPPLLAEEKKRLNRNKNPFFEHAEAEYFLAFHNGELVGRITAQIDRLHNKTHNEKTGFFGFFETVDEPAVAHALLDQAATWLQARGMECMRGPFNFSINEESGILIKGHEHAPFVLTTHSPDYYAALLETAGLNKVKDLYCWRYDSTRPVPEMAQEIADEVRKYPGLTLREIDPKRIYDDVNILIDVFNSAWQQNWGFVPLTTNEIKKAAEDFKMILEPKLALIAEVNGVPAAISLAIPNLNEIIRDLNGRLFPTGFLKLLYRLKRKKCRSARLMLLGIKKEFRGDVLNGLVVLLYSEMHRRSQELKHWGGELSWTLEDNQKINVGIQMMGGENYKTYRVFERAI